VISRRDFLTAAGAGAAVVPLLRPFASTAFAQGGAPKRAVFVYSANGTVQKNFFPADAANLTDPPILKPFEAHKNDLIVVKGLAYSGFNTPHSMGTMKALTNIDAFDQRDQTKQPTRGVMYAPSLDTVLAKSVGARNLRPVVRMGPGWGNNRGYLMFDETGQVLSPIGDPVKVFEYVFGAAAGAGGGEPAPSTMPDPAAEKRLVALREARKSILDIIRADANALKNRLPAAQKSKMDQALQSISELEKNLLAGAGGGGGAGLPVAAAPVQCKNPSAPAGTMGASGEMKHKVEADLVAMTLGCDVSRVVVWKLMGSADGGAGPHGNFHNTSHQTGTAAADEKLTQIHTYLAGRIAYLVERLKATKDPLGTGSVFDNSVVYWMNECGHGNHDPNNLPILLAGSCGGQFKTGRLVLPAQTEKGKYGNLLVSIANALGDPMPTFGDKRWCTGPLTGLAG
jgi:hypothetical protein